MQVVILCGGQGTRIRDVAGDLPKPLLPVGTRPLLWHIMKGFAHQGFRDFILCLGYMSSAVKRYFLEYQFAEADLYIELGGHSKVQVLGSHHCEDWRVTLAETGAEAMTGCRIKRVEKYVVGEHFLLTYGDGVADIDLPRLVQFHLGHDLIGTVTAVRPPGRYGEIRLNGRQVASFTEKPPRSRGWVNGGFFVFRRGLFERLRDDPGLILEREPLTQLASDGELAAYPHTGFWQSMDNSRDYQRLNELWAGGRAPWAIWNDPARRVAA
jgi:glucose-1-phosphate cytidylyltransferase